MDSLQDLEKSTGIKTKVINEISELAFKYNINRVILFGSRARGDFWRASDIDLAVSGGNITSFSLDVEDFTSTLLMYDVVDLDRHASDELGEEIRRDGKLLYEKVR
ncbi:MAG: nucleotidyltransferase domain-containing protein [Eubacterium sp.]|nr:nucleotidyltransferase domain-containing protein [Eubacterium sp.]